MRTRYRFLCTLLLPVGLMWNPTVAQEEYGTSGEPQLHHEVCFGLGGAVSFEKDLLNLPGEDKVRPDFAMSLAYRYYVTEEFAFGIHIVGFAATTPQYSVVDNSGASKNVSFTLGAMNVGIQGRYTPIRGTVMPYLFGALSAAMGSVEDPGTGTLRYFGVTCGGGLGVAFFVSSHFALSVEGCALAGTAKWRQKPFENSSSDDLNPSMLGFFASVSYCWSE